MNPVEQRAFAAQGIPSFLKQAAIAGAGNAVLGGPPPPAPPSEVQRELDQLHMELGDLESLFSNLAVRLQPVSHPNPVTDGSGVTANCSSQVGQQISSSVYRVGRVSQQLRELMANLAI